MPAYSAGACTTTLYMIVNIGKGGGCAPFHPHQAGLIFHHDKIYLGQKAAVDSLRVLSGSTGRKDQLFMTILADEGPRQPPPPPYS